MDREKHRRVLAELHTRLKQARAHLDRRTNPQSWCELDSAITLLERIRADIDRDPNGMLKTGA
jgi:hypothetical protein